MISPKFGRDYFGEEAILRRDTLTVDSRISPVAFNQADFNEKYNLLAHEIQNLRNLDTMNDDCMPTV